MTHRAGDVPATYGSRRQKDAAVTRLKPHTERAQAKHRASKRRALGLRRKTLLGAGGGYARGHIYTKLRANQN